MTLNTMSEEGITADKQTNFSDWYVQIVQKGGFIKYYDVSGCYIMLPNSYGVWEQIKAELDSEIKELDVQNAYFPLLISKKNLSAEEKHIEDFSPEVAWITKTGSRDLTDPKDKDPEHNYLAIRPTSECAIYPTFAEMIRSHNDLPLKINQWCNVVRWEFKSATPFIRSREFLWQEGHTCHTDAHDAETEALQVIKLYKKIYNDLLAVPVIAGCKTDLEKFPGAVKTFTVEGFIKPAGKGIQCATSHCLGTNFSKIFDISYQDKCGEQQYVFQNSWGFTTRSIGVMLMTHGDNRGAIIPPKIATIQIVIIPIIPKNRNRKKIIAYAENLNKYLRKCNYRAVIDLSDHKPGWKFNHWEVKGVPIRFVIGPKELEQNTVAVTCRTGERSTILFDTNSEDILAQVESIVIGMQQQLLKSATEKYDAAIERPKTVEEMKTFIDNGKLCLIGWCYQDQCEENIKAVTGAKSLCLPLKKKYQLSIDKMKCVCGQNSETSCLFGKSF